MFLTLKILFENTTVTNIKGISFNYKKRLLDQEVLNMKTLDLTFKSIHNFDHLMIPGIP